MKNKFIKLCSFILALCISLNTLVFCAFASETDEDSSAVEVTATITGADNTLSRANALGVAKGTVKITDDNHIFSKDVEVWATATTKLISYSSNTANGIPDWYLYAKSQILVSNGDIKGWVSSPTSSAYDTTSVSAKTKVIHAKDGGSAEAQGFHTVKDYNQKIIYTYTSSDTENF